MRRCGRTAIALLLLGLAGAGVGCRGAGGTWEAQRHSGTSDDAGMIGDPGEATSWPFAPASMRVHPLTRRIDEAGGGALPSASAAARSGADIEVRIECIDADGFETRAVGILVLDLSIDRVRWTVGPIDLGDPRVNLATFEGVTRTYRIGVSLPPDAAPEPGSVVTIVARLQLPGGQRLENSFELPWR